MPSVYRVVEIGLYALVNYLPFLILALYPVWDRLRFSRRMTVGLVVVLSLMQITLGIFAAIFPGSKGALTFLSTMLYALFYFLAAKVAPGKSVFTLLMISNLANFCVMAGKCLENAFFPAYIYDSYRWSFSLCQMAVELVLFLPLFLYIKRIFTPAIVREPSGDEWKWLWLIPAIFYVVWYYALFAREENNVDIAIDWRNIFFLFFINAGACLVYAVVAQLLATQWRSMELQAYNHGLAMQKLQYELMQEKIQEARQAKHDVRHHITMLNTLVHNQDLAGLEAYLKDYQALLPEDSPIVYCENTAVNALLFYFSQQARKRSIGWEVTAILPEDIPVLAVELSVLFGNLLENALYSCAEEPSPERRIRVAINYDGYTLCAAVDNTFTGVFRPNTDGSALSTRHGGVGLGLPSVRSIAKKYHGVARFEATDGTFRASVMLNI